MQWIIAILMAVGPFEGDVTTATGYAIEEGAPVFAAKTECMRTAAMANGMERARRTRPPKGATGETLQLWLVGSGFYKRVAVCVPNDAIGIDYLENLIRHEADLKEWGLGDEFAAVTKKGLR